MVDRPAAGIFKRQANAVATAALADTRVVLVEGPRQAGKTTLVREFAEEQRPFLSLDDQLTLTNAKRDPVGFIRSLNGAVIDEIQRAPELMLAIIQSVDIDTRPGDFYSPVQRMSWRFRRSETRSLAGSRS